eukprot:Lithocolla_globosa_v1_NODE_878_length_3147_cov_9.319858.p2 type:complete len:112 gc:universal NODE_878_length_3147_cov_9.319858:1298-1633(+)
MLPTTITSLVSKSLRRKMGCWAFWMRSVCFQEVLTNHSTPSCSKTSKTTPTLRPPRPLSASQLNITLATLSTMWKAFWTRTRICFTPTSSRCWHRLTWTCSTLSSNVMPLC